MKKLLSILASLSFVTTSSVMAVSCNKYEQSTDEGDSILVNFLENLGVDGKTQLTASDVLLKLINTSGVNDRQTLVNDLTNLLETSIMANVNSVYTDDGTTQLNTESRYFVSNLKDTISQAFTNINSSADSQIAREKASYKEDYGWRWKTKWRDYLAAKFPIYQKKYKYANVSELEKKYKSSLLLTSSDYSAASTLQNILISTDQYGVTWASADSIIKQAKQYNSTSDKDSWFNSNKSYATEIVNGIRDEKDWITQDSVTKSDLDDAVNKIINGANVTVSQVPTDISKFTSSDAVYRSGFLSNSQKYFVEKWYSTKAPLATSYIKFPFATNAEFDKGINDASFQGFQNYEANEINTFMSDMFGSGDLESTNSKWDQYMSDTSLISKKYTDASATVNTSLVTLSDSSSVDQEIRNPLYNYVFNKTNNSSYSADESTNYAGEELTSDKLKSFISTTDNVKGTINTINRVGGTDDVSQGMYGYWSLNSESLKDSASTTDTGYLFIVTSDGLLIYRINGFDHLLESSTSTDKSQGKTKYIDDNGKIDTETLEELKAYKEFYDETDAEKVDSIQINPGDLYDKLNGDIKNDYLKYLLNNSLLDSTNGSTTKFDVMTSVKSWATQTDSPSSSGEYQWVTYIIDYFRTITTVSNDDTNNSTDSAVDQGTFINTFIVFGDGTDEIATSLSTWYTNALKSMNSVEETNTSVEFHKSSEDWIKTIKKETTDDYPKAYIQDSRFEENVLPGIIANIWWSSEQGGNE